jgi:hypothetical protein
MDKSIMAMADDILGGALSEPAKQVSSFTENSLPEISDEQRQNMINESLDEKLGKELEKYAKTKPQSRFMGKTTSVEVPKGTNLSARAKVKLSSHRSRLAQRRNLATSGMADRPQSHEREEWQSTQDRLAKHKNRRGVKTRGAPDPKPTPKFIQRSSKRARKDRLGMENSNLQILLQARDILRELKETTVGMIGTNAAVQAGRAYSTHGANMGTDNVSVAPVDKALRNVEQAKKPKTAKKPKKGKKLKKESFEMFLDRILDGIKG